MERDIVGELKKESDELYEKIEKLRNFLSGIRPKNVSREQWELLIRQKTAMMKYYDILILRIYNLKN